jgi:flagellar assembly protein FliH
MIASLPKIIRFSAPLRGVRLAEEAPPAPAITEADLDAARRGAYEQGAEEATRLLEQQMLELRAEVVHLQQETFAALVAHHDSLTVQFRELLPELAMRAVRQILAGVPIERSTVVAIVEELLSGVDPDEQTIDVQLSARDLELIAGQESLFRDQHPAIAFRVNPGFQPGDCLVRTRFGTLDARLETKLDGVEGALRAS